MAYRQLAQSSYAFNTQRGAHPRNEAPLARVKVEETALDEVCQAILDENRIFVPAVDVVKLYVVVFGGTPGVYTNRDDMATALDVTAAGQPYAGPKAYKAFNNTYDAKQWIREQIGSDQTSAAFNTLYQPLVAKLDCMRSKWDTNKLYLRCKKMKTTCPETGADVFSYAININGRMIPVEITGGTLNGPGKGRGGGWGGSSTYDEWHRATQLPAVRRSAPPVHFPEPDLNNSHSDSELHQERRYLATKQQQKHRYLPQEASEPPDYDGSVESDGETVNAVKLRVAQESRKRREVSGGVKLTPPAKRQRVLEPRQQELAHKQAKQPVSRRSKLVSESAKGRRDAQEEDADYSLSYDAEQHSGSEDDSQVSTEDEKKAVGAKQRPQSSRNKPDKKSAAKDKTVPKSAPVEVRGRPSTRSSAKNSAGELVSKPENSGNDKEADKGKGKEKVPLNQVVLDSPEQQRRGTRAKAGAQQQQHDAPEKPGSSESGTQAATGK